MYDSRQLINKNILMIFVGQSGYPGLKGEKGISIKGEQGYPGQYG